MNILGVLAVIFLLGIYSTNDRKISDNMVLGFGITMIALVLLNVF